MACCPASCSTSQVLDFTSKVRLRKTSCLQLPKAQYSSFVVNSAVIKAVGLRSEKGRSLHHQCCFLQSCWRFLRMRTSRSYLKSAQAPEICASAEESDPICKWITTEGGAKKVIKISPVSGGCINIANRYDTDVGPFFVKTNNSTGPSMFEAEARGLQAMYEAKAIRVPRPYKVGPLPRRGSYIIMEYIQFGSKGAQANLGRQLAEMHLATTSSRGFGFDMDNTIGSTPQENPWTPNWVKFFRVHRLGFQLNLALQQYRDVELFEKGKKLLGRLPDLLGGVEVKPCLLHGDLWSGNITADQDGNPVILDPACYYGHNEAEFGMSWCASFGPSFYDSYFEVMPKQPGFADRVELYKLYHYLNHYNLFGSGYRGSCTAIIDRFI